MERKRSTAEAERPEGALRVFTSMNGDLAEAVRELVAGTGSDAAELARQGFIRLVNEARRNGGKLTLQPLIPLRTSRS